MKNKGEEALMSINPSRRDFIKKVGAAAVGMLAAPYLKPSGVFEYNYNKNSSFSTSVAITDTTNTPADSYVYDDKNGGVQQKVNYILQLLDQYQTGKVSTLFKKGKKVAIKINLTGGSGNSSNFSPNKNARFSGFTIAETMWTHPAVLHAVGQFIIDSGVNPSDIYIVESFWDTDWKGAGSNAPFGQNDKFGYSEVQKSLGCNVVDLNDITTDNLAEFSTGSNHFNFPTFTMNKLFNEIDVYVSIPKLKHHATAGITASIKNQVGSVPKALYTITDDDGDRGALHHAKSSDATWNYLPESICDLAAARPVHLAVIDGIKCSTGGEGVWCPAFSPAAKHTLIAGLDPVASDSIAAKIMGLNPEANYLPLPAPLQAGTTTTTITLNHLFLLNQKNAGTNKLSEIQVVGDGARMITSAPFNTDVQKPAKFRLCANFPNPFNPSTKIVFYLPRTEYVTLVVYDVTGREIETLVKGEVPAGEHRLQWNATGLASGIYLCRMKTKSYSEIIKMLYQK